MHARTVAEHLAPELLRDERSQRRQHQRERRRGLSAAVARVERGAHLVRQHLQLADRHVEPEPLHVVGDGPDRAVGQAPKRLGVRRVAFGTPRRRPRTRGPSHVVTPGRRWGPARSASSRCRPRAVRRTGWSGASCRPPTSRPAAWARRCCPWSCSSPRRPDHLALVHQPEHRLGERDHPHVVQHLGEETAVEQVEDRVLDAARCTGRPASTARPPRGRTVACRRVGEQ